VRKICPEADEILSPHRRLTNSPPSEGKYIFLHNRWTEFYKPTVVPKAHGNAKMMGVKSSGSAQNWMNVFRIPLWRQVVTLDDIGDARSEWHSKE
jgi:hypothetical protein